MNIVKPSYEILDNRDEPLKLLEKCGRVCYKSEDKITDDSCIKFVSMIKTRKHESVLEHVNYIFRINDRIYNLLSECEERPFLRLSKNVVSGNVRAWYEFIKNNNHVVPEIQQYLEAQQPLLFAKLPQIEAPTLEDDSFLEVRDYYSLSNKEMGLHCTMTVRFICNRGFTHELVRHRPASFSQESTRYCNYSKDKFGSELTFIEPAWFSNDSYRMGFWEKAMQDAETHYIKLIEKGCKPQEARGVLPIDIKTEIVMTATLDEWKHVFSLRTPNAAHPSMQELMRPLESEVKELLPEIFNTNNY